MNWMKKLAYHYEGMKQKYPKDKLMILFDIDGTILDMRHMILHVLKSFDEEHGFRFFSNLTLNDITIHENQVEKLLSRMGILKSQQGEIMEWYNAHRWTTQAILSSHRPFVGVMEVIRWFQIQPNTFVALNTGRPDIIRPETLRSLNRLGEEYKIHFEDAFLHMNPQGWEEGVRSVKAEAVHNFREKGYRVFAMVDNEPDNLKAVSEEDPNGEILLLHANTIFESKRRWLPPRSVSGKIYDITELIGEKALP